MRSRPDPPYPQRHRVVCDCLYPVCGYSLQRSLYSFAARVTSVTVIVAVVAQFDAHFDTQSLVAM